MSGASIVALGVVAALSLGAQPKPAPAKIVSVEIIVDSLEAHTNRCEKGDVQPTTVLVVRKEPVVERDPFHCVERKLIGHKDEDKDPLFDKTLVRVSTGQSIRWFSKVNFRVAQVRLHEGEKGGPPYPFIAPMPTVFSNEVTSPPVRDEQPDITRRYKIEFDIEKEGNRVDPDTVCSM